MAAPVVESSSSVTTTTRSSTTIAKPTGTAEDDLLVLVYHQFDTGSITLPSGFTALWNTTYAGFARACTAWKVAGASEPTNYTVSHGSSIVTGGVLLRISGADTTTPIDVSGSAEDGSSPYVSPSITTTADDCLLIATYTDFNQAYTTPPTGYTEEAESSGYLAAASDVLATAGASGTAEWSPGASGYFGHVGIAPSAGASTSIDASTEALTITEQAASAVFTDQREYLRPDGTDSAGSWTTDTGATTNLHLAIDEVTASDADFIQSEESPSTSVCRIALSNPAGNDPSTTDAVALDYRFRKEGSATINIIVRLEEGTTTIASQTHNDVTTSWTAGTITLSTLEKNNVTNWDNMVLEVEATQV